jgi:superfamily I DNA/RNA helicase
MIVTRVLQREISVLEALASLLAEDTLSGMAAAQAQEFKGFVEHLAARDPDLISPHIVAELGLEFQIVRDQLEIVVERIAEPETNKTITECCDLLLPETRQADDNPQSILFLTMHSSKGLTRRNVVMPGLEAAWLPGEALGNELAERRRLFYVALTRATNQVLMTFPVRRGRRESLNFPVEGRGQASPFIREAGLL